MARGSDAQAVKDDESETTAAGARPDPIEKKTGIAGLIQKIMALRIVRAFQHYTQETGALMSAGMTYQALFAIFAALAAVFTVAGFALRDNPELQDLFFSSLNSALPGLVDTDGNPETQGGIIDPAILQSDTFSQTFGLTGVIAFVGLLFTALGFLDSMRTAVRRIFDMPAPKTFIVLLKAKDLGLAIGLGLLLVLSTLVSIATSTAVGALLAALGFDAESPLAVVTSALIGFAVIALLDTIVLAVAYRVLSGVRIPPKRLFAGAGFGGVIVALLQTVGANLLRAPNNPLLASFAVLLGLLVFVNVICQVLLVVASWIATGMRDANIDPRSLSADELQLEREEKLEEARRLVAKANLEEAEERARTARGFAKRRAIRALKREARREAKRRQKVPTVSERQDAQPRS